MTQNPVARIKRKKLVDNAKQEDGKKQNILTPTEINALLAATDDRYKPLLMTAILTGLRQSELLGLKWGDIDFHGKQLYVQRSLSRGELAKTKTTSSCRTVPLSDVLIRELKKWKLRCPKHPEGKFDLVFPNRDGKPEHPDNLRRRVFYPSLRRAGLRRIRFHDLRHNFASLLIAQNVNVKVISVLMGHSSIKVTLDVYGHLLPNATEEVAERLGRFVFGSGAGLAA